MGPQDDYSQKSAFSSDADRVSPSMRTVPIIQTNAQTPPPSSGEPMEVNTPPPQPPPTTMSTTTTTATTTLMGPPAKMSPDLEANGSHDSSIPTLHNLNSAPAMTNGASANGAAATADQTLGSNTTPNAAAAGLAGGQQPKVVQTAFIHKLYKYAMPRDGSLQDADPITVCSKIQASNISSPGPVPPKALSCLLPTTFQKSYRTSWAFIEETEAYKMQPIFQAYQYFIVRSSIEHVWISQRYGSNQLQANHC